MNGCNKNNANNFILKSITLLELRSLIQETEKNELDGANKQMAKNNIHLANIET